MMETCIKPRPPLGYDGPRWAAYFWFVGWDCWSLGLHICVSVPNIEIHLPFGFIRIGAQRPEVRAWMAEISEPVEVKA